MSLGRKRTQSYVIKTRRDVDIPHLSSEDEEDEEEYKKGGYHPVEIGNLLNNRYEIVSKLGWGHFSTVWKAHDSCSGQHVAVKIVKSAKHYTEAARDEVKILTTTTRHDKDNTSSVIHLLDTFDIEGPHGTHVSMVFEKLGCNMLTLIRMYKYRGLPPPLVRMITKQMVIAMEYLHRCLVIHTDLKPENMLLVKTPQVIHSMPKADKNMDRSGKPDSDEVRKSLPWDRQQLIDTFGNAYHVKVVDLGNACWTYEHFTEDVQTRQYRAPEVILGTKYTQAIDIWSMACIVFELLTGDLLFEPKSGRTFEKDDDHMAQISELLGPLPLDVALSGTNSRRLYTPEGQLRNIKSLKSWPLRDVLMEKYKFVNYEAEEIAEFLTAMLTTDPKDRATAAECLNHRWIKDIDLTNFESCLEGWF